MASAADIKARISGISETKKVTDAMFMISSVKQRRARSEVSKTAPYYETLKKEIGGLLANIQDTESRYFKSRESVKTKQGILLITSDKGLSGGYNRAVLNLAAEYLKEAPDTVLFIIGEYGRKYFNDRKIPFVNTFYYSSELPDIYEARKICTELLEYYDDRQLNGISMIYTDYKVGAQNEARAVCLLPLEQSRFDTSEDNTPTDEMEFYPDRDTVLDGLVPNYLTGIIYGSLVDSYCCEQEARMTMMSNAGNNADAMLAKLKLQYNAVRQAAITREMIEITSGARALAAKKSNTENNL